MLSTAKLFLQPARELYLLNNPHSSRKRFLTKSYLLPVEATGKCHLRVTRKRKPNRTAAVVAIQAFAIHVVALFSPAHSPLCQLQLLHFYPLHQNIKSVDLYFFGLSFTWGRMGTFLRPSSREEAQSSAPLCLTLSVSPQHTALQGCQQQDPGMDRAWRKCHILFQGQLSELPAHTAQAGSISRDRRAEGLAGHTGVTRTKGRFCFPEPSLQWSSSVSPLSISTR